MLHLEELTTDWTGIASLVTFVAAYVAVIGEERLKLRKSQPVLLAAGLIWGLVGVAYTVRGEGHALEELARHNLLEYTELLLFLLVAMTYVNTMEERGVFDALRDWLIARRFSYRLLFWVTGGLAFCLSPIADNLTTALVMGAVCVAVGTDRPRFVTLACINVVVAANAGGAFSPFGDITTLMVWQADVLPFFDFFVLFLPALVTWLVPAVLMSFALPGAVPPPIETESVSKPGAPAVASLFAGTIVLTVAGRQLLNLPPAIGMMAGLGALKVYSYLLNRRLGVRAAVADAKDIGSPLDDFRPHLDAPLDTFKGMEQVEWDTLLFFYGVMLSVGGLGALGYLAVLAHGLYDGLGATVANVLVGVLSAIVDNVPVMFGVLSMNLQLSEGQWLLVTLTTGVGGSLLSVGSAAGIALMGQARGHYSFGAHLRWVWAIALGYAAGIGTHLTLNHALF